MNNNKENENAITFSVMAYIHKSVKNNYIGVNFHYYDEQTKIQHEREILSNGIFEKLYKDGKLIESFSIIQDPNNDYIETRFNPQGQRIRITYYQKDGTPKTRINFKDDIPIEETLFKRNKDNHLLLNTFNDKDELIYVAEFDEKNQEIYCAYLENGKPYQTKETKIRSDGIKCIKHEFLKTNGILYMVFNQDEECIGEYHYKDNELIISIDAEINKENGTKAVTIWNKSVSEYTYKNIYQNNNLIFRYIYDNGTYVGFVECVYDSTPNRYEVLFRADGVKISCSTYDQNNNLIEYGEYKNGVYCIQKQKTSMPNDNQNTRDA